MPTNETDRSKEAMPGHVASTERLGVGAEAQQCVQAGGPKMCEHLKCTYEGMDGERYRCDVCGRSYFLDYEDMR